MITKSLNTREKTVLKTIADGAVYRRADGRWAAGKLGASVKLIDALEREKLVARTPDGRLRLTMAGEALCQNGTAGGAKRILVERALPEGIGPEEIGPGEMEPKAARPGGGAARARRTRSVTVNLTESPLGWLMARGMISERQFAAGERLRADWTLAGLSPRVTMRWDAAPGHRAGPFSHAPDPTLTRISARRRFDQAVAHAGGGLSDILWRVVCANEGLVAAETALGWPKRAAKLVLGMALDRVADFYAIS